MTYTCLFRPVYALILVAAALGAAGCDISIDAAPVTSQDKRQFAVSGAPDLRLATFDGSIEVRTWDRQEVVVEIEKRGPSQEEIDKIEIKVEQNGDKISVETRRPAGASDRTVHIGFHQSPTARLVASVPARTNLVVESGDGSVTVEGVSGRLDLRTSDGSINGADLKGQLRVHTSDGSVTLKRLEGSLDVDTEDGRITLDGILSALRAETRDGSINVRVERGSAMNADWDVQTGDGSIAMELPEGFSATLDAHTGDGTVHLNNVPLTKDGETGRRDVKGKIGSGGPLLKLRTGDGSITVRELR